MASAILLVLSAMTVAAYASISTVEREQLLSSKERAATMLGELFAAGVTAPLSFDDEAGVREHLGLLSSNANVVYAGVWDVQDGVVGRRIGELSRSPDVTRHAPSAHTDVRVQRLPNVVVLERPITTDAGETVGMARLGFSLRPEHEALEATRKRTLASSLALALTLGLAIIGLTRTLIVRRLARLARAAKSVEDGGRIAIEEDANDEVGKLARAFVSMGDAIAEREAHISSRNRDMRRVLDNVAEGFITIDKDGVMSEERSRVVDEWFGAPPASRDLVAYVASFAPEASEWIRLGLTSLRDDFVPWEVVLDQMARRFEHGGRFFHVDFRPIAHEDALEQILTVVRDVTSEVKRERAEQEQREALQIFRRVLDDRIGFDEFFREADRLVEAICQSGPTELFDGNTARDIHTLKGNAALFGLESISSLCHALESRLFEEGGAPTVPERAHLRAAWLSVKEIYRDLSRDDAATIELPVADYESHVALIERRAPHQELIANVRAWRLELASRRLERVAAQAHSLARRLGKGDTKVHVSVVPPNLRLPSEKWRELWTAFTHVLRNTFDHGIESGPERVALGKPIPAAVSITLAVVAGGVELRVEDDGRGIAWERIRERARERGLPCETATDLEEALFADKVSSRTSSTEVSGRGVGMGAVRQAVRACGGEISIVSEAGRGTTLRFRFPADMLDANASPLAVHERRFAS